MEWLATPTVQLIMYFRDDDGAISRHTIHIPIIYIASAVGVAKHYGSLVSAVSSCALWKMHISTSYSLDGPAQPAPGSSVYHSSVFIFQTLANTRYVLGIPGLNDTLLYQPPHHYAGIQIDPLRPAIAALVAASINGVIAPWNGTTGDATDWGGEWDNAPWGDSAPGAEFLWDGTNLAKLQVAYRGYDFSGHKR